MVIFWGDLGPHRLLVDFEFLRTKFIRVIDEWVSAQVYTFLLVFHLISRRGCFRRVRINPNRSDSRQILLSFLVLLHWFYL